MNTACIRFCVFCLIVIIIGSCHNPHAAQADKKGWVSLFNGRDMNDWIVKINHCLLYTSPSPRD